jgi:tRNA-2-methylthio-N6-dimethylallyladenosine synthase
MIKMQLDIPVLSKRTNGDLEIHSSESLSNNNGRKVFIETYGCQMNVNDSEIVSGILVSGGYSITDNIDKSDVILLNTCSVRDNAEAKIFKRLTHLRAYQKKNSKLVVGILGCMAERLRGKLMEHQDLVTIVVGPDEYRKVPNLLDQAFSGEMGIAVKLSKVETYDDIIPFRTQGISAWISIMRGCDKFCTYCVVPFTRGRERSKPFGAIIKEIASIWEQGYREVTLLGQNVNSYFDKDYKADFPKLMDECAKTVPEMRIRYTTSHPYDMSDCLIETMANHKNICNYVHLPVQSGSDRILDLMNRDYTVSHYKERMRKIKELIPNCALSTDIISGFPTETEDDHKLTLDLMAEVRYDGAYMFNYSPRSKTHAYKMEDDVPAEIKSRRLTEIIDLQNLVAKEINHSEHGKIHEILVEGQSKKKAYEWQGRSDTNKVVIFDNSGSIFKTGDLVKCEILKSTSATLFGKVVE